MSINRNLWMYARELARFSTFHNKTLRRHQNIIKKDKIKWAMKVFQQLKGFQQVPITKDLFREKFENIYPHFKNEKELDIPTLTISLFHLLCKHQLIRCTLPMVVILGIFACKYADYLSYRKKMEQLQLIH